jgi:hypothetical protein
LDAVSLYAGGLISSGLPEAFQTYSVHFYVIKPLYDIPEQLLNIVPQFMIFSKSKNTIPYKSLILYVFLFWHETGLWRKQIQDRSVDPKRVCHEMG